MQTFIPLAHSYAASVAVLDYQRLGKQRVETMQLVTAITGLAFPTDKEVAGGKVEGRIFNRGQHRGWQHHPAAVMWSDNVLALLAYQEATCDEWEARGYLDTCREKTRALVLDHQRREAGWGRIVPVALHPSWWGDDRIHASHRANLVRKLPERYLLLWPNTQPINGYIWPSPKGTTS